MGAVFFSYVYTTVCLLRITESEKQQREFGNKERPVLRKPKMYAKRKKKVKADTSVDGKSKNCGTAGNGNKDKGGK